MDQQIDKRSQIVRKNTADRMVIFAVISNTKGPVVQISVEDHKSINYKLFVVNIPSKLI